MEIINKIDFKIAIPIIISLISLLISLVTALTTWKSEKFKIDFEMVKWLGSGSKGYPVFIWMYVTNYSKLPCSILEVELIYKSNRQVIKESGTGSKKLISRPTSTTRGSREIYSLSYPININSYSSVGGYFHISSEYGSTFYEDKTIYVVVKTNRGIKKKKIFMDFGKNVVRSLEYQMGEITVEKRSDGTNIEYLKDKTID